MSTSHPTTLPLSIKGVLLRRVDRACQVLLLRNDREEWELPGGRLEQGEQPEDCLSREFIEETGLTVRVGPRIHSGVLTVNQTAQVMISAYGCFLKDRAESNRVIALSSEHCGARWIGLEEVADRQDVPDIYKTAVLIWNDHAMRPR